MENINNLRLDVEQLDNEILGLLSKRGELVKKIGLAKQELNINTFDPSREQELLSKIDNNNPGPYHIESLKRIFKEIFAASKQLQNNSESKENKPFLFSRDYKSEDTIVNVNGENIGDGIPRFIMGPCAVESFEQVHKVAAEMSKRGVNLLRGGAFKPRTSPYDFQGLGIDGLKILSSVSKEYNMGVITEIMSIDQLEEALEYIDVIQVGARNMQNFSLLKAVGQTNTPVLLKRGLSATIEEFKLAAEYILAEGNPNVILCERGIRTYETATRNTLDISAVPILKQETHLPVVVDVTHSTGRKDLLIPTAKAALAIGADAIMAEVHPNPAIALSDSKQQMNFDEFNHFMDAIEIFSNKTVLEPVNS
ncbi:bifunctional 3-deoxy-7-phosphoheptulonate synthase/chorismate mutase [Priestia megaterium]|uniref:bifunctional 3-deoxy-7-phosphoheptulonate synthase/chorismate mutase n=1 Tax=Priestia megaterium TaxID=1404 RepID=UPI001FAEC2CA|nr:bifunctional 3-deoxy-7-phosphoheptulonate synthase/chorismate mutase [Priestia megaterium]